MRIFDPRPGMPPVVPCPLDDGGRWAPHPDGRRMARKRNPGDQIEGVFTIGSEPFIVMPATVVEDTDDCIAHFLARGARYLRRQLLDGSPVPRVVGVDELAAMGSRLAITEWRSNQLVVT